jgi:transcriptional regulator with XRE-family HTH domain
MIEYPPMPGVTKILKALGETIRQKRKARMFPAISFCKQCDISRATLRHIEKGDPGVSMGRYTSVMIQLGMGWDLFSFAVDDPSAKLYQSGQLRVRTKYAQISNEQSELE